MPQKPIIGLTGGPGAGKTAVARQFHLLGCAVIDADQLNTQVLARPEVIHKLVKWWGRRVLDSQGLINRKIVGQIVFENTQELQKLTNLTHPFIIARQKELLQAYQSDPQVPAVVLDVPLLYEAGQDNWCDFVVWVEADEKIRQKRLKKNRGWEKKKLKKIEKLQIALDIKAQKADHIIRNNSDIPNLAKQVARVLSLMVPTKACRKEK